MSRCKDHDSMKTAIELTVTDWQKQLVIVIKRREMSECTIATAGLKVIIHAGWTSEE